MSNAAHGPKITETMQRENRVRLAAALLRCLPSKDHGLHCRVAVKRFIIDGFYISEEIVSEGELGNTGCLEGMFFTRGR